MRSQVFRLALVLAALGAAVDDAASGGDGGDDLDLDGDDFEDDEAGEPADGSAGGAGGGPPVEDFDLGMPEEEQKTRMRACFAHSMRRVQAHQEQLQETVKEMTLAHKARQMTPEQAINTIVFSWMMTCYMNIDGPAIESAKSGAALSPELEQATFSQRPDRPQQVQQASKRQWQLLETVLVEQQAAQQGQEQSAERGRGRRPGGSQGGDDPLGAGMSGQNQVVYLLVVFGVIFGIGGLAVLRLMRRDKEGSAGKDRSGKSAKKAEKAEKKLARKKL